jgi:ribonuclease P protein subunit RPR2
MVSVARDRMAILIGRAEEVSRNDQADLARRYVELARRIGTRYNVRIPPALKDRFCPGCSTFFREGLTVRTRLNPGGRTRTCLQCGRIRRQRLGSLPEEGSPPPGTEGLPEPLAVPTAEEEELDEGEEPEEG